MQYKAEIFDEFQYLYETTGFSDHQVHCVMSFEGKVDASAMEKAARQLIKTVPILSRTYKNLGGKSCWEDAVSPNLNDLFKITDNRSEFESFTVSRTNEETGPQIKFCLLRSEADELSVVINHMVSDASGFKQCIYLFSDIYSNLVRDKSCIPDYIIDGDRGFKGVISQLSAIDRMRLLLFGRKDNNQELNLEFPLGKSGSTAPFIAAHEIAPEIYQGIREYCHENGVTVNDVILSAYFRVLAEMLDMKGGELAVPIMIDMRRYLRDKSFSALTNLSSTTIVKTAIGSNENFSETLGAVSTAMKRKKAAKFGLNTFIKLDAGFRLPFINAYVIMSKVLKNPKISMTNIGILDSEKLRFENSPVANAVMFASIKYRPHFQISVTSFKEKMTLGAGLYGSENDRAGIEVFFRLIEKELKAFTDSCCAKQ